MSRIKIVTDSTCDLPQHILDHFGIIVVPLKVYMDDEGFIAGIELSSEDFYKKMPSLKEVPSTSPPTTMDFFQAYEKAADDAKNIISIHISRKMSQTIVSAENARMMLPSIDIKVIDSLTTGASLGLIILQIAFAIQANGTIEEIYSIINDAIKNVRVIGYASTLKYLIKGGRIGRARGLVGTIFGRIPILTIQQGETSSLTSERGIENAVNWILNYLKNEGIGSNSLVALTHGNVPDEAEYFRERITQEFNCEVIFLGLVGPVVGSHLGPGSIFFSYIKND